MLGEIALKNLLAFAGFRSRQNHSKIVLFEPSRITSSCLPVEQDRQQADPAQYHPTRAPEEPVKQQQAIALQEGAVEVKGGDGCHLECLKEMYFWPK